MRILFVILNACKAIWDETLRLLRSFCPSQHILAVSVISVVTLLLAPLASAATLIGIRFNGTQNELLKIDTASGGAQVIKTFSFDSGSYFPLSFGSNPITGRVHVLSSARTLYSFDIKGAAPDKTVSINVTMPLLQPRSDGLLIGFAITSTALEYYSVDPNTGSTTPLGSYARPQNISFGSEAVDFKRGIIYFMSSDQTLYRFDTMTQSLSTVHLDIFMRIIRVRGDGKLIGMSSNNDIRTVNPLNGVSDPPLHAFNIFTNPTNIVADQSADLLYVATNSLLIFDARTSAQSSVTLSAFNFQALAVGPRLNYVALGDSYSAGVGAGGYQDGQQKRFGCYRSSFAYSQEYHHVPESFLSDNEVLGRSFFACSGAQIPDVLTRERFSDDKNTHPEIVTEIQQIKHPEIESSDFLTLSIGGNDIGFEEILGYCFKHKNCQDYWEKNQPKTSIRTGKTGEGLTEMLASLREHLRMVYRALKEKAPLTPMYVLGYPRIFADAKEQQEHPACLDNNGQRHKWFGFEPLERDYLNDIAADLDKAIRDTAESEGMRYVPVIGAFKGHELCSGGVDQSGKLNVWWIYQPFSLQFPFVLRDPAEWFHPTLQGQEAYAKALKAEMTKNGDFPARFSPPAVTSSLTRFAASGIATRGPAQSQAFAASAKQWGGFGSLIVEPVDSTACGKSGPLASGQAVRLTGFGFSPNTRVEIRYQAGSDGPDQRVAQFTIDANGALDASVIVPSALGFEGVSSFEARGTGSDGLESIIFGLFYQTSNPLRDTDGDGVPDWCDVSPNIPDPSQADRDGDGIGDASDPCPDDPENLCVNQIPFAHAGFDRTVSASSSAGASVILDGSLSGDPDGDVLTFNWKGSFGVASGVKPTVTVPIGASLVTLTVSDGQGGTAMANAKITVVSNVPLPGDLNGDGKVDCADLAIVKASFGKRRGQPSYDSRADVNTDGVVDVRDLAFVSQKVPVGTKCQ